LPLQQLIKSDAEYEKYIDWLGDLVEGLNSAHIPNVPGECRLYLIYIIFKGELETIIKQSR